MRVNLTVEADINPDDLSVALSRRDEEGEIHRITTLEGYTASEIYVKFGIKVPEPEPEDGEADAIDALDAALKAASTKTVYTASELQDILLDARNKLGGRSVTEELPEDD